MTKREKKQYQALRQRIGDIYHGALGQNFDKDQWANAEILSRVIPALKALFGRKPRDYLFYPSNLHYFDTPDSATDFLWGADVRATDKPQKEE